MKRKRLQTATALVAVAVFLLGCQDERAPAGVRRGPCAAPPPGQISVLPRHDQGACLIERGVSGDQQWFIVASWDREPPEGLPDDPGPCIDIQVSTGTGGAWCDLPRDRLIGEWVEGVVGPDTTIAWGPTAAGRVATVRIEFADGPALEARPKPSPWLEFDYWVITYPGDRRRTALVALDPNGQEISREPVPPAGG